MIDRAPRLSVDEPLVGQRVTTSPHPWGLLLKHKLVVQRVWEIDNQTILCFNALKPKNLARRQAKRGSSVSQEVCSVLCGILTDEELVDLVIDAAHAANVSNTEKLRAELELRLTEYRLLRQYGSLDEWDYDSS